VADRSTYPPLDVLKGVAEGIWIVDSGPMRVLGLPLPVRMTVIRLGNGDILLHSPTRFTDPLRAEIERIGPIRHLVAPNIAHWSFLQEWQRSCPQAITYGAPGLRQRPAVRKSGVRLDQDLTGSGPSPWGADIEQEHVPFGKGFGEIALFHRPSRTLVLTDLVVNLEAEKLPVLVRPLARLLGVLAPDGRAPAYLRLIVRRNRREAAPAMSRLLAKNPERVIFAHGRWFDRDASAALRRSVRWLVD
jgi:hypothetical protein